MYYKIGRLNTEGQLTKTPASKDGLVRRAYTPSQTTSFQKAVNHLFKYKNGGILYSRMTCMGIYCRIIVWLID